MAMIDVFRHLADKGDYKAIADFATDIFMRITVNAPNAEDDKLVFQRFIEEITVPEDNGELSEKNKQLLNGIMGNIYAKTAVYASDAEKDIRKNVQKIKNGEMTAFSFFNEDNKMARKAAEALSYSQYPESALIGAVHQAFMVATGALSDNLGVEVVGNMRGLRNTVLIKQLKTDFPDYPDKKLKDANYLWDLCKCEYGSINDYGLAGAPVGVGEAVIISKNFDEEAVRKLSADELNNAIKTKEEDIVIRKNILKTLGGMAGDAAKLKTEIAAIQGIDKTNKFWQLFESELNNTTKFGTADYMIMNDIGKDIANNPPRMSQPSTHPKACELALNSFGQAIDHLRNEYQGKNTDEAKAALAVVEKAQRFKDEHDKLVAEQKKIFTDRKIVDPAKDIELLKTEQENRALNSRKLSDLQVNCFINDQKINVVKGFTLSAQRGIDMLAQTAKAMSVDSIKRKKGSPTYREFVSSLNTLTALKANETKPEELLEKMKTAYDAACAYEEAHTTWKHMLSGYSDDGKDRIKFSQATREILGRKIEELTAKKEQIKSLLDDEKPSEFINVTEYQNETNRRLLNEEKDRLCNANFELYLNREIRKAQNEIKREKDSADDGKFPDKEACRQAYCSIVAANHLKMVSKNNPNIANVNNFRRQCQSMAVSTPLKTVIEKTSAEDLFRHATTNEGKQLFQSYAAEFSLANPELSVKKPKAPAANVNKVKASASKQGIKNNIKK